MRLDTGDRCDQSGVYAYRQSREAGRGCLEATPAEWWEDQLGPHYRWVDGYPATAHEMHPEPA